jgi:MFS family permease
VTGGRYRALFDAPGVSWLLTTSLVARLPVAMANLAIILRVAGATGSYARAGAVTACYVIGTALMSPVLGRAADRIGRRPVLLAAATVNTLGLVSLAITPVRLVAAVFVLSALSGASVPPVAASIRSLWPTLVEVELRSRLYALDATLQELTFVVGPTLVALLSSVWDPSAALVLCGVIGLTGTATACAHPAIATLPVDSVPSPKGGGPPSPRPQFRDLGSIVAIVLLFLSAVVMVEVTVVAFATHHHASHESGLLLAVWSLGSMAGGFAFGSRAAHHGDRVLALLLVTSAVSFFALTAASGVGVLFGLMLPAGISIAPAFSCIYGLVGSLAVSGSSVEAFSWVASGIQTGAAFGAFLGGLLVDDVGTRWTFVAAAGGAVLAAGVARWRSNRRPAPASPA